MFSKFLSLYNTFSHILFKGISLLFTGAEEFIFIGIINGIYAFTILLLFFNFYSKSYSNEKEKSNGNLENSGVVSPKKTRKLRKDDWEIWNEWFNFEC